jgi:hypothetical protein
MMPAGMRHCCAPENANPALFGTNCTNVVTAKILHLPVGNIVSFSIPYMSCDTEVCCLIRAQQQLTSQFLRFYASNPSRLHNNSGRHSCKLKSTSLRRASLHTVIAEMQHDLTVLILCGSPISGHDFSPCDVILLRPSCRAAFTAASGSHVYRARMPRLSHPWFRHPQPLTDVQAPSFSGRYPCLLLLVCSKACPCSS